MPVAVEAAPPTIVESVSVPTTVSQVSSEYRVNVTLAAVPDAPGRMPVIAIESLRIHDWTVVPDGVAGSSSFVRVQVTESPRARVTVVPASASALLQLQVPAV